MEQGPTGYLGVEDRVEAIARIDPLKLGVLIDAHPEPTGNMRRKAFTKHFTDSSANQAGVFHRPAIPELGQHGSCHALLAVPADEIGPAEAEP
jgi:hypothetical protein